MANLNIPELETRMRPGAWSVGGFLGPNESLADVLRYDAVTLTRSGLTHRQVADALGRVIETGISRQIRLWKFREGREPRTRSERLSPRLIWSRLTAARVAGHKRSSNLFPAMFTEIAESQVTVGAEAPKEPGGNRGCRCAFPLEHVWFSYIHWCGYQTCPWDCGFCLWSDLDFRIENERVGDALQGPGLIVHLIREHQFFEGFESPYRVDPMRLVQVLELSPPAPS